MSNEDTTKAIPEKKPSVFTQEQKDELRQIIYANLTNYADIMRVQSGVIESGNYVAGSTGWALSSDGSAEVNNLTARGTIIAGSNTASKIVLDSSDGKLKFYYGNTQYAEILVDSAAHFLFGSDNHFFFDQALNVLFAQLNSTGLILPSSTSIFFTGGSTLVDGGSYLAIKGSGGAGQMDLKTSGTVYPETDINKDLGANGKRYYTLWSKYLTTGDIIFSDRYCPICQKEFEEGDMLVNFVHKIDKTNVDRPLSYTIPAHFDCVKDYKKENHDNVKEHIRIVQEESDLIHKEIEKEFDKKMELEQKKYAKKVHN